MKHTGQTFYHTSIDGFPVFIQKLSLMDIKYVSRQNFKDIQMFFYILHEKMLKVLFPFCSNYKNKRIDKIVSIIDLEKISVWSLFTKVPFIKLNIFLN